MRRKHLKDAQGAPHATWHTRAKNNTQYDPRTGRLVNTECPICEAAGRDPWSHTTPDGKASCRGHLKEKEGRPARACTRKPMRCQNVCMVHGGKVPHNMEAARRRIALVAIKDELDGLGGSLDVDPAMAMLAMVREAAFNVAYLRTQVAALRQGYESSPGAGDGIVGRLDPENWTAAEHVLVAMYDRERDRLVKYSKLCRDAGVEERRVRIEEEQGAWLTRTVDLLLERLALTPQQQQALPAIMGEVIDVLEKAQDQPVYVEEQVIHQQVPAPEPPAPPPADPVPAPVPPSQGGPP